MVKRDANETDKLKDVSVVDCHTKAVVGRNLTFRQAHRKAERLNQNYGAVRYTAVLHVAPVAEQIQDIPYNPLTQYWNSGW